MVAIIIATFASQGLGKDASGMGLWFGLIFFVTMMAAVGIESAINKLWKPRA